MGEINGLLVSGRLQEDGFKVESFDARLFQERTIGDLRQSFPVNEHPRLYESLTNAKTSLEKLSQNALGFENSEFLEEASKVKEEFINSVLQILNARKVKRLSESELKTACKFWAGL